MFHCKSVSYLRDNTPKPLYIHFEDVDTISSLAHFRVCWFERFSHKCVYRRHFDIKMNLHTHYMHVLEVVLVSDLDIFTHIIERAAGGVFCIWRTRRVDGWIFWGIDVNVYWMRSVNGRDCWRFAAILSKHTPLNRNGSGEIGKIGDFVFCQS